MREIHGADTCVTAWVDVELLKVTGLPYLHHSVISSRHQILTITAQQHGLTHTEIDVEFSNELRHHCVRNRKRCEILPVWSH